MFAPAIAALITVRWVAGESLGVLKLRRLGPKRFYLWAWLLPPLLAVVALLFTLLLGFGLVLFIVYSVRRFQRHLEVEP